MTPEQLKDAETPEEMRAAIFLAARHDPITRQVMDMADCKGMSGEDRYTVLAYHALKAMMAAYQREIDFYRTHPAPMFVVDGKRLEAIGRFGALPAETESAMRYGPFPIDESGNRVDPQKYGVIEIDAMKAQP